MYTIYACMSLCQRFREAVHTVHTLSVWVSVCVYVCVLARVRAQIGLLVGAVYRESGKAEGQLYNSTFLRAKRGVSSEDKLNRAEQNKETEVNQIIEWRIISEAK